MILQKLNYKLSYGHKSRLWPREPEELAGNVLPTHKDILLHESYLLKTGQLRQKAPLWMRAKKLAKDVVDVCSKCNIETADKQAVRHVQTLARGQSQEWEAQAAWS